VAPEAAESLADVDRRTHGKESLDCHVRCGEFIAVVLLARRAERGARRYVAAGPVVEERPIDAFLTRVPGGRTGSTAKAMGRASRAHNVDRGEREAVCLRGPVPKRASRE
jgi:hypothetical protein